MREMPGSVGRMRVKKDIGDGLMAQIFHGINGTMVNRTILEVMKTACSLFVMVGKPGIPPVTSGTIQHASVRWWLSAKSDFIG